MLSYPQRPTGFKMISTLLRLPLTAGLMLALSACSSSRPFSAADVRVTDDNQCPINLVVGQNLTLDLPSNPSTGFRWKVQDHASELLSSLAPEDYLQPEGSLVGAEGTARWRFKAKQEGAGRILMSYQRPWEATGEAAGLFDCRISVAD
ncbi:inhibitor of cysteine peptidase [Azomonas agilis]|uniref:Inhibitor of cysteine peptidase n=2 Tax=Azomonas agilis TaxID=116849 RepID=A0A562J072_9GAMM|nr:inhibitor of cysteine peptidase [Azomonas agilis]